MTETTEASMAMYDLNFFSYDDVAENRKEGEDGRHGRFAVDHEKRNVVDLEAIGKIANPRPTPIGVGDDDYLVTSVDEFGR